MTIRPALLPVRHCRVSHPDRPGIGLVVERDHLAGADEVTVRWFRPAGTENLPVGELAPAFEPGAEVRERAPQGIARDGLGRGTLVSLRRLGGAVQACVQFRTDGRLRWVPWQHLSVTRTPADRFVLDHAPDGGEAERVRLRTLAELLTRHHEEIGALPGADGAAAPDPDPDPDPDHRDAAREIAIVRRLLEHGNPNRLLTGVAGPDRAPELLRLLSVLEERGRARRVLFVVPGRTLDLWQGLLNADPGDGADTGSSDRDFVAWRDVEPPRDDGGVARVIVAHERAVAAGWLGRSGTWDLVVVDEAHRLVSGGEDVDGGGELCNPFRLATDSLLLITSAPHAGRRDRLRSLLRLVRPDAVGLLREILDDPSRLEPLVIVEPLDEGPGEASSGAPGDGADGSSPGVVFHRVDVRPGSDESDFHAVLHDWSERVLRASNRPDVRRFSLPALASLYRRLAGGCHEAVRTALRHRLHGPEPGAVEGPVWHETLPEDGRGRFLAAELETFEPAFDGEADLLATLVAQADALTGGDAKIARLVSLVESLLQRDVGPIVVATGLRTAAHHVRDALLTRFGVDAPLSVVVDGDPARPLPNGCRTLVNVDCAWDAVRMAERLRPFVRPGRVRRADVFDLCAGATVEERAAVELHRAVREAARELAAVQGVVGPAVENEWVAHLGRAIGSGVETRRGRAFDDDGTGVRGPVAEARESLREWATLSRHAARPGPDEPSSVPSLTPAHVRSFFDGMCRRVDATVLGSIERPGVHRVVLDQGGRELTGYDQRSTAVAFDPAVVAANEDVSGIDMDSGLFRALLRLATSRRFGGRYARVAGPAARTLALARLRWHDDLGRRRREEVRVLVEGENGEWADDPVAVAAWLAAEAFDGEASARDATAATAAMQGARAALDGVLAAGSTGSLHPAEVEILATASRTSGNL